MEREGLFHYAVWVDHVDLFGRPIHTLIPQIHDIPPAIRIIEAVVQNNTLQISQESGLIFHFVVIIIKDGIFLTP